MEQDKNNFIIRLLSGILLIVLLFFVLYMGGDLLFLVSLLLSIIGLIEIYRVLGLNKNILSYLGFVFTFIYYYTIYNYKIDGILLFLIVMLLSLLIFYVFSFPSFSIKDISLTMFSIIYVAMLFSFVYLIREQFGDYGKQMVWLIFISSWGSDTFAYVTGKLFGKHKLTLLLSPKKTIEGAVGGVLGSFILGVIYAYFMFRKITVATRISMFRIGIACAFGAFISLLGDLTASAIKREFGVKDYGDIIPGHGGVLDRFDSVIFAAPALFFILSVYK